MTAGAQWPRDIAVTGAAAGRAARARASRSSARSTVFIGHLGAPQRHRTWGAEDGPDYAGWTADAQQETDAGHVPKFRAGERSLSGAPPVSRMPPVSTRAATGTTSIPRG